MKQNPHSSNVHALPGVNDAIPRRVARDVILSVVDTLILETGASRPRIAKILRQDIVETNDPQRLELVLDLVAALEQEAARQR